jgi:hypothetical protein
MGWVLCACEIEERENGVVAGANSTLCVCESEDREYGVGDGVNSTLMSDTL